MKYLVPSFCIPLLLFTVLLTACPNKEENACAGFTKPNGKFITRELIGDTAFAADTIFRDNYVQFMTPNHYDSVRWQLGTDPRIWTNPAFSLSFYNTLGTVPVNFTGIKKTNSQCFPGDAGIYTSTGVITLVEQVEKPFVTLSPLIGKYGGSFTDRPSDSFTVRLEYFDSTKYDASITGSKNFYWFSNMPDGFIATTNAAYAYPELRNGYSIEMGYKCFVFDYDSYHQGKAWLSHDTIYINTGDNLVGRRKFIGIKK